jgi:hypothetical protein
VQTEKNTYIYIYILLELISVWVFEFELKTESPSRIPVIWAFVRMEKQSSETYERKRHVLCGGEDVRKAAADS